MLTELDKIKETFLHGKLKIVKARVSQTNRSRDFKYRIRRNAKTLLLKMLYTVPSSFSKEMPAFLAA